MCKELLEDISYVSFFGVYDGHGGAEAADYLCKHLHVNFAEALRRCILSPRHHVFYKLQMCCVVPASRLASSCHSPVLPACSGRRPYRGRLAQALRTAFRRTDEALLTICRSEEAAANDGREESSGAAAAVVVLLVRVQHRISFHRAEASPLNRCREGVASIHCAYLCLSPFQLPYSATRQRCAEGVVAHLCARPSLSPRPTPQCIRARICLRLWSGPCALPSCFPMR
jgi:serine/threonine protein phosphatase PrpC